MGGAGPCGRVAQLLWFWGGAYVFQDRTRLPFFAHAARRAHRLQYHSCSHACHARRKQHGQVADMRLLRSRDCGRRDCELPNGKLMGRWVLRSDDDTSAARGSCKSRSDERADGSRSAEPRTPSIADADFCGARCEKWVSAASGC